MASRLFIGLLAAAAALVTLTGEVGARRQRGEQPRPARPDFDVRAERRPAPASARARAALDDRRRANGAATARLHPYSGAIRRLDSPGWSLAPAAPAAEAQSLLARFAAQIGLDEEDVDGLVPVRDFVSRSNAVRHLTFAQSLDGLPVFDAAITMHVAADGTVIRVTSSAARGSGREREATVAAEDAASIAAADVAPDAAVAPVRVGGSATRARFSRAGFRRDIVAALVWLPMDGGARLAWHVDAEPGGEPALAYDLLVDARSGELLLRRNRVLDAEGSGRIVQSDATFFADPRRPDQMPAGAGGCPPVANQALRHLSAPFRDPGTVLFDSGRLSGNNVHVYRGNTSTEGALGILEGTHWIFDEPFNTAASAETALFFAVNFAHDFFYDLGFDEAAGNFQVDNFGRGGLGGDPVAAIARAPGRNNATFRFSPDGTSPVISMFLFDGLGCWSQDVDGDGTMDLDGDYDTDIILHEFHHGVSTRLSAGFNGAEAGAMGEGGGDFFAYSINGDTRLAEFSRPGGLRGVNAKTYAAWACQLVIFCEVHANGEIWANALWEVRERFRRDLVRGSEAAAINEAHQLYIDALALSPPAPTMLDMRDAMLLADELRQPGMPQSPQFCALWESFAGRGMGVNATDTADNGLNRVTASFAVPPGCTAPPAPALLSLSTISPASEAGPTSGGFTISRTDPADTDLVVSFGISGTAVQGVDVEQLPLVATIPAGATGVTVPVTPIDDSTVEVNETVILTILPGAGYAVGAAASATVTVVSDDAAPDFAVTALAVPALSGAGLAIEVTDTTRNQGGGPAGASTTSFYLSVNGLFDTTDPLLGVRDVPALAAGGENIATTTFTLPTDAGAGTFRIFAKADGPGQWVEGSEFNNVRSTTIRLGADLVITNLTVPAALAAGVPFTATYTGANQGGVASPLARTRFYLSINPSFDAADLPLQVHEMSALDAGTSQVFTATVSIAADTAGGAYYLLAVADADNQVPESTETNNTRSAAIRLGPDLRVTALAAPVRAVAGTEILVTDTVQNIGAGGATASRTGFYLSVNVTVDAADIPLDAYRPVQALAANTTSAGQTTVVLPSTLEPGVWQLLARADDAAEVAESTETNNVRGFAISIGPDLGVVGATAPGTVQAGTTISVTDSVRNTGAGVAEPSTTLFYFSLDLQLDANDIPLPAERSVPALAFNETSTGPSTIAVPAGLSGRYYLIVVADGRNAVTEARENNNLRLISMMINP